MLSFDWMAFIAATIYFLGIYLHYIHILTIFHLLERYDELNFRRTIVHSLVWPWTVLMFLWAGLFGDDEEDEQ